MKLKKNCNLYRTFECTDFCLITCPYSVYVTAFVGRNYVFEVSNVLGHDAVSNGTQLRKFRWRLLAPSSGSNYFKSSLNTLTLKTEAPSSSGLSVFSVPIDTPSYTRLFESSLSLLYKLQISPLFQTTVIKYWHAGPHCNPVRYLWYISQGLSTVHNHGRDVQWHYPSDTTNSGEDQLKVNIHYNNWAIM